MNVTFMRIDTRVIHGQIVVKWCSTANANVIYVVDKTIAADPFLAKLYCNAAPKSIQEVRCLSPEQLMEAYKADEVSDGNIFIIFKDIENCYQLWKLGFPFEAVDVGNQAMKPGKRQVLREVFLSDKEYAQLKEMHDAGVNVYAQIIPERAGCDFKFIADKMEH